jgi:hypothetical protein
MDNLLQPKLSRKISQTVHENTIFLKAGIDKWEEKYLRVKFSP